MFRWYETAFMKRFGGDNRIAPFAMPPGGQDAALALSPALLHTHRVAWPFKPTDQGDEESFTERWMGWFGKQRKASYAIPVVCRSWRLAVRGVKGTEFFQIDGQDWMGQARRALWPETHLHADPKVGFGIASLVW